MSSDAVALFRPRDPDKLRPFLDLDEGSEDSDGLYAEPLDDGSVLVFTFQPFEVFEQNPSEAHEWLAQFGEALPDVHDDPRGLLFFPDTCEPDGTTYDAVVAEVGDEGVWIPTSAEEPSELVEAAAWPAGLPPIDMQTLQTFAGQLLGSAESPATSFEVAKLFESVQQGLLEAFGVQEIVRGARPEGAGEEMDAPAEGIEGREDEGREDEGGEDAGSEEEAGDGEMADDGEDADDEDGDDASEAEEPASRKER